MPDLTQEIKKAQDDLIKLGQEKLDLMADLTTLRQKKTNLQQEIEVRFASREQELTDLAAKLSQEKVSLESVQQKVQAFLDNQSEWQNQLQIKQEALEARESSLNTREESISFREVNITKTIDLARETISQIRGTN